MKYLKFVIVVLAAAYALAGCGSNSTPSNEQPNQNSETQPALVEKEPEYKEYGSEGLDFIAPSQWEYTYQNPDQYFTEPEGNIFSVERIVKDDFNEDDFEDFIKDLQGNLNISDFTEISRKNCTLAGVDAFNYVYTCTSEGTPLYNNVYLFFNQGYIYKVTFSSQGEKQCASFDAEEATILNSLELWEYFSGPEEEVKTQWTGTDEDLFFDSATLRWKMSSEELLDTMVLNKNYHDFSNQNGDLLHYYYSEYDNKENPYDIKQGMYWFFEQPDQLNAYSVQFEFDEDRAYQNYAKVRQALVEKLGEPDAEDEIFTDETYKDDYDKSIKYDYLSLRATWTNNEEYDIVLRCNNGLFMLTYCDKGYAGDY